MFIVGLSSYSFWDTLRGQLYIKDEKNYLFWPLLFLLGTEFKCTAIFKTGKFRGQ